MIAECLSLSRPCRTRQLYLGLLALILCGCTSRSTNSEVVPEAVFSEFVRADSVEAIKALPVDTMELCLVDGNDDMVAALRRLAGLKGLALTSSMPGPRSVSNISESAISAYLATSMIERLHISHDRNSGNGLLHTLASLKSLRALDLYWVQNATEEGADRFRQIRPDVEFNYYELESPSDD